MLAGEEGEGHDEVKGDVGEAVGKGYSHEGAGALHHPGKEKADEEDERYVQDREVAQVQHGQYDSHVEYAPAAKELGEDPLKDAAKH